MIHRAEIDNFPIPNNQERILDSRKLPHIWSFNKGNGCAANLDKFLDILKQRFHTFGLDSISPSVQFTINPTRSFSLKQFVQNALVYNIRQGHF